MVDRHQDALDAGHERSLQQRDRERQRLARPP
jgi:hypothetical protein